MVKTMFKQLKQLNELDSLYSQVENLHKENITLANEIDERKNEIAELKSDFSQLEQLFFDAVESLKKDIGEVPVAVFGEVPIDENILKYELRTSPQTQSKNYRYYYKSNYLFTAPLNLKNALAVEFNNLMNSNLSFENVVAELKIYKDSLINEMDSNGVQTALGVV